MFMRYYTCVLEKNGSLEAIEILAPSGKDEAQAEVKEHHPAATLVAMVPGMHAANTHVYRRSLTKSAARIDPFELPREKRNE